jgi:hypothetical protein
MNASPRAAWRGVGGDPVLLAAEVAYRARRAMSRRTLRAAYDRLVAAPPGSAALRTLPIDLPGAGGDTATEEIRASADAACRHEFDVLGSGPVDLGPEIDWHSDFKSGHRWPRDFYLDVEVTRLDDDSDAKVPWEMSRGHELLALARAARAFAEPRYGEELASLWSSWLDANPPGVGINWTNAMEVGIRAVNWAWALTTAPEGALDAGLRARILASLRAHGRHLAWNLEGTPRLRSNHYLADVLGLLVVAAVVEEGWSRRWARRARAALRREIGRQVGADGLGFEASTGYHGLSLEMLLLAEAAAAMRGAGLGAAYRQRLAAMAAASAALRGAGGRIPALGDGDSGRILPISPARPPSQDPQLWMAAGLLGTPRPGGEEGAGELAWTLGVEAARRALGAPEIAPASARFPDGGVFVLAEGDTRAVIRCGGVGQNGNGGHAHNDALSIDLELDGAPLVVDPGTPAYTADLALRNEARSTRSHNTVQIGDQEINPIDPGRPFAMSGRARIWFEEWDSHRMIGCHDGFRAGGEPVVHRRRVELAPGRVEITDELSGPDAECTGTARLHLAPGTAAAPAARGGLELHRDGRPCATLTFAGAAGHRVVPGWVSDRFGVRADAEVVELEIAGELPLVLRQTIERTS